MDLKAETDRVDGLPPQLELPLEGGRNTDLPFLLEHGNRASPDCRKSGEPQVAEDSRAWGRETVGSRS